MLHVAHTSCFTCLQLIRSMKNALVKQTQEAAKRVAAPTQRQRLGTRRQRASAAAAAAGGGCAQDDNEEEGGVAARYFCDDMQEQFAALLQGEPPPPDLAAQLVGRVLRAACPSGSAWQA